jgi:hypothetical protein
MESVVIWIVVGLGTALVLSPFLLGALLAARQQVTRVELVKAPAAEVWDALTDLPRQIQWRSDLKSVQMLDDDSGLRWVEQPGQGSPVTLRKSKEIPLKELLLGMDCEDGKGTRQARLSAVPGGTRVTFVETLDTPRPLARLRVRTKGGLDAKLDRFILELKQKFRV